MCCMEVCFSPNQWKSYQYKCRLPNQLLRISMCVGDITIYTIYEFTHTHTDTLGQIGLHSILLYYYKHTHMHIYIYKYDKRHPHTSPDCTL